MSAAGALLAWAAAVLLAAAIVGSIVRGVAGLGAVMAMAMHATVLAAMAAVFSLPLTVSGLAGYALAVAIGFDYAVVVFQRKGERRQAATRAGDAPIVAGLAPRLAIRDSGLATLLICAALWWVGAPSVTPLLSDFASTLFVGLCGVTATTALLAAIVLPVGRDEIADAGAAVFDRSGGLAYAPSGRGQEGK